MALSVCTLILLSNAAIVSKSSVIAELEQHIHRRTAELIAANAELTAAIEANKQMTAALQTQRKNVYVALPILSQPALPISISTGCTVTPIRAMPNGLVGLAIK